MPDELVLVLKVVVPALEPESPLDPPQPEDAATSARVTTPQPKIRKVRAIVMRAVSSSQIIDALAAAADMRGRGSRTPGSKDEPIGVVMARLAGRTSIGSGASRARTGDLLGAIQALSQLSYSPAKG